MAKLWFVVAVSLSGLGVGIVGAAHHGSSHGRGVHRSALAAVSSQQFSPQSSSSFLLPRTATSSFPVNAAGQTYGSSANVTSLSQEPTLVWVQATNGKLGYVYASQLYGPTPKNPQQAITWASTHYPKSIPVYAQNGKTVIGHFVIGGSTVVTSNSAGTP